MSHVASCALYESRARKGIVGIAQVKNVHRLPLESLWELAERTAMMTKAEFDMYFAGTTAGFGIELADPRALAKPISISELRQRFRMRPPQSFCFAPDPLHEYLMLHE